MRGAAVTCLLVAVALAGCGSISDEDRRVARAVVDAVERNMQAADARDARAYCAGFTEHYLRDRFRGGYATCVRRFRGPAAAIERSPDARYLNADPTGGSTALVHFTLGEGRQLDYVMKLTEAAPGTPRGKRWLIDGRAAPEG